MTVTFHKRVTYPSGTFGGKAAGLGRLQEVGFHVPPFVVALVAGAPSNVVLDLEPVLRHVGPGPYAVRSSATQEDGLAHSHAGQFLSLLDVTPDDLPEAVARVVASGDEVSVKAYRQANGITAEGRVAVVVQAMVPASAAGVLFTADPVGGRRDRIVISAVAGLADRLVQGEAEGSDYVLDKASGRVIQAPSAGPSPEGPLSPGALRSLHAAALRAEAAFGTAQDIEWAFHGEVLHCVQVRPITTPLRPVPNPDTAETILDNSNIVESYPGLVSTLTYSFAVRVYARVYRTFFGLVGIPRGRIRAAAPVLDNLLTRVDGRVYYNLVNWYRALALIPGFGANRKSMETMMGVSEPLPEEWSERIAREVAGPRVRFGKARVLVRLVWRAIRLPRDAEAFRERLAATLAVGPAQVDAMSLSELASEYRRVEAALLDRWDAPLVNDFLCMAAFGGSRRLLERWCGEAGLAFHNDVMIGQGDIVSAEPARRIRTMARLAAGVPGLQDALLAGDASAIDRSPPLRADFDEYLAKFGDRCVQELKLESIPLSVDPSPLVASIARPPGPAPVAGPDPDLRLRGLLGRRPLRFLVARMLVRYARARVRDRENLRFERTRVFAHARRVFLAMGRQYHAIGALDAPRDALDLTVGELMGFVEGNAIDTGLKALVRVRQAETAGWRDLPDPPERMGVCGPVSWVSHSEPRAAPSGPAVAGDALRKGTGCGGGIVAGTARVIHDPRTQTLEPGEILVARHTDPGWIAVFAAAAAIVVERGSLLSHSAIVARELGIPCVVGLKDATRWLATGDRIRVDGGSGTVERTGACERTGA